MVEAEQDALKKGKTRKEAIYAAYDRFTKAISPGNLHGVARNRVDL